MHRGGQLLICAIQEVLKGTIWFSFSDDVMAATPEAIVEVIERVYLLIHSFQISIFNCDLFEKDWIVRLLQHLCHRVFKVTVKQRGPVLAMGGDEGLFGVGEGG